MTVHGPQGDREILWSEISRGVLVLSLQASGNRMMGVHDFVRIILSTNEVTARDQGLLILTMGDLATRLRIFKIQIPDGDVSAQAFLHDTKKNLGSRWLGEVVSVKDAYEALDMPAGIGRKDRTSQIMIALSVLTLLLVLFVKDSLAVRLLLGFMAVLALTLLVRTCASRAISRK